MSERSCGSEIDQSAERASRAVESGQCFVCRAAPARPGDVACQVCFDELAADVDAEHAALLAEVTR